MFDLMTLLNEIQEQLKLKSTRDGKLATQKFVPNSQEVYGTRMPDINELAKQYKAGGFELAKALWTSGAYEERILAAKILNKLCKKDPDQAIQFVEKFSNDISDWAVCDTIGMQSLKPVASTKEKEIFALAHRLSYSDNLWQRRLSLVLVEVYTKNIKLHSAIKVLVKKQEADKEYYVIKAVEWINRNLNKHASHKPFEKAH